VTGYQHPLYAASFAEWGQPRALQAAGGWVLERDVSGAVARDAMGCYPLFACADWRRLGEDLDAIGRDLVSLALVTDPFAGVTPHRLHEVFPDLARPYKAHFVVELARDPGTFVHTSHLRNAVKARRALQLRHGP